MRVSRIAMALALTAAAGMPLCSRAQDEKKGAGDTYGLKEWPTPISQRPLTLGAGMFELTAPVNDNLTSNHVGEPVNINPSLYVGFSDNVTLGVRTFRGLCVSGGGAGGCPNTLDDFAVDSVWSLGRSGPFQVALGLGVDFVRLSSPMLVSGEARFEFKWGNSRAALVASPTINFGLSNRNDTTSHPVGLLAPGLGSRTTLTATAFGNRETLTLPVGVQVQLTPKWAVVGNIAVTGPLDPVVGGFPDYYTIPVSIGGVYALNNWMDLGLAATWPRLIGNNRDPRNRYITGAVALRF